MASWFPRGEIPVGQCDPDSFSDGSSTTSSVASKVHRKRLPHVPKLNLPSVAEAVQHSCQSEKAEEEHLANKGFTVKQLLSFFDEFATKGIIQKGTKTFEVVRDVILPETCDNPRAYMESLFMEEHGGAQVAERYVSHAWECRFVNTVLNIVLDATGLTIEDLVKEDEIDREKSNYGCYSWESATLDARRLLDTLDVKVLRKTYWLCIFAVNQHQVICGDCSACNEKPIWVGEATKHLVADPCLLCEKPKRYPCACGSTKIPMRQHQSELNQFQSTLQRMQGLVVSLDPDMTSLTRSWVLAEIGHALQCTPVYFRAIFGISAPWVRRLEIGRQLIESVEKSEASRNDDKEKLLDQISEMGGGTREFDLLVNAFFDVCFGRCFSLAQLSAIGREAFGRLKALEIDFQWRHEVVDSLTEETLGTISSFQALENLHAISCNFRLLTRLKSLTGLGKRLALLVNISSIRIDFSDCLVLVSIHDLVELKRLSELRTLALNFAGCTELMDISGLSRGLKQLQNLQRLDLNFQFTRLRRIPELGEAIQQQLRLRHLVLNFEQTDIYDVDTLGNAIKEMRSLRKLALHLRYSKVNSILQDSFHTRLLFLHKFSCWQNIATILELGYTETQAREALVNNDSVELAIDWLNCRIDKITTLGFTQKQAQDALAKKGTISEAAQWLRDVMKIVDKGFSEAQAKNALNEYGRVESAVKSLEDVAKIVSQGFPERAARKALLITSSIEEALMWLKVDFIMEHDYTEEQALDALKQTATVDEAIMWLKEVEEIVSQGFPEQQARVALRRKLLVEEAITWLKEWKQVLWRCAMCQCRMRMSRTMNQRRKVRSKIGCKDVAVYGKIDGVDGEDSS